MMEYITDAVTADTVTIVTDSKIVRVFAIDRLLLSFVLIVRVGECLAIIVLGSTHQLQPKTTFPPR